MESIRDVLKGMKIPNAIVGASTATWSNLSPSCPTCGGAGWLRQEVDVDDLRFGKAIPCGCTASKLEEKRMSALLERSNLKSLGGKTFASFAPQDHQQPAYNRAREFAENPDGWLVMLGSYGTGKTHLAAAIGNRRLELGEPAVFVVAPDLLDHLRSTFSPTSETTFDKLFESVRSAPLLILDDMGTQTTTQWASEKLFQILNYRYMNRLATIITTNVPLDDLGDRLASRMADPELSIVVSIAGPDLRTARQSAGPRSGSAAAPRGARPPTRTRPY